MNTSSPFPFPKSTPLSPISAYTKLPNRKCRGNIRFVFSALKCTLKPSYAASQRFMRGVFERFGKQKAGKFIPAFLVLDFK